MALPRSLSRPLAGRQDWVTSPSRSSRDAGVRSHERRCSGSPLGPARLPYPRDWWACHAQPAGSHALRQPARPTRRAGGREDISVARSAMPGVLAWSARGRNNQLHKRLLAWDQATCTGVRLANQSRTTQSIARSAPPRAATPLPREGIQPGTLRTQGRLSMKRPGDPPVTAMIQPSGPPRSHARVGMTLPPAASADTTHGPRPGMCSVTAMRQAQHRAIPHTPRPQILLSRAISALTAR